VRAVLAAVTLADGEPAAGIMAAAVNIAGFEKLLRAHGTYHAMTLEESTKFTRDRTTYRPVLGVSPFGQGPGDMAAFDAIEHYDRCLLTLVLVYFAHRMGSV
jgi:hypothetical protein